MAKSSGGPSLVTLLLLAGGAYVVYEFFFASSSAAATSATPATPLLPAATTGTAAPVTASSSAAAGASTLDAMYQNMVNAATQASFSSGNPDQWGFYYAQGNPPHAAPAPENAGFNRTSNWPTNLSAAQYWAAVSPQVSVNMGFSGLGLLGGLGAYVKKQRGW